MAAPGDSFIVDWVRAEAAVSRTAIDLALAKRKGKAPPAAPLPLGLDLVAQGTLALEAYLRALAASERRSAPCPRCGAARYVSQKTGEAPCPGCGDPRAPRLEGARESGPESGLVRFEQYAIEKELGRGAMGVVYRAVYRPARRVDALKLLLPSATANPERLARFERERALLARVSHPNVIGIHRSGQHGGLSFLALEYVNGGRTLRSLMDEGPLPIERACRLVAKVARGVGAAHDAGVLHRDLKPENVLLDEPGEPHVADFGLARTLEDSEALTRTGSAVGTPLYMSYEQLQGKRDLDARTDVYALGAILYEAITGVHPHAEATSYPQLLQRVQAGRIAPLVALRGDAPFALTELLARTLSPHRSERPETANDLARRIEASLAPAGSQPDRARRLRPALLGAAAVGLVVVGALGVKRLVGGAPGTTPDSATIAWRAARAAALRDARAAIEAGDETARDRGTGAAAELETAATVLDGRMAALGPAPSPSREAEEDLARVRSDLARARIRAALLDAAEAGPTAALALAERLAKSGVDVALARAEVLLELGRPEEAAAAFAPIAPTDERARLGLARALVRAGRLVEARGELARTVRGATPAAREAWLELVALDPARTLLDPAVPASLAGPFERTALAHARALPREAGLAWAAVLALGRPTDAELRRALGEQLLACGVAEAAAEVLEGATFAATDPLEVAASRIGAAEARLACGEPTAAEEATRPAIATLERPLPGRGDAVERRRFARALRARGLVVQGDAALLRHDRAGALLRYEAAARADPASPTALVRSAEALLAVRDGRTPSDVARAAKLAEQATAVAPGCIAAWLARAEAELARERRSEAGPFADRAVELACALGDALAPEERALALAARGRLRGDGTLLAEAARLERQDPLVRAMHAEVYAARLQQGLDRAKLARMVLRAALVARPRSAAAFAALAEACALEEDALAKALDAGRRAVASNSELGEAHLALGNALALTGRGDDAVVELRAALARGAPPGEAALGLGLLLLRLDRGAEAADPLDAAIRWEPFNESYYRARAQARHAARLDARADEARAAAFLSPPDVAWQGELERARARVATDPRAAALGLDALLATRPHHGEALLRRGVAAFALETPAGALVRLARAVYADPAQEEAVVRELAGRELGRDGALRAELAARDTDVAEASYALGLLELIRASERPDEAARSATAALLAFERATAERPVFHAARLARGLAKALLLAPRAGLHDAKDAFVLWPMLPRGSRLPLAIALARAGENAEAERELAKALEGRPRGERPRPELGLLPPSFRAREGVRSLLER